MRVCVVRAAYVSVHEVCFCIRPCGGSLAGPVDFSVPLFSTSISLLLFVYGCISSNLAEAAQLWPQWKKNRNNTKTAKPGRRTQHTHGATGDELFCRWQVPYVITDRSEAFIYTTVTVMIGIKIICDDNITKMAGLHSEFHLSSAANQSLAKNYRCCTVNLFAVFSMFCVNCRPQPITTYTTITTHHCKNRADGNFESHASFFKANSWLWCFIESGSH